MTYDWSAYRASLNWATDRAVGQGNIDSLKAKALDASKNAKIDRRMSRVVGVNTSDAIY